jgi:anti-anti-sigma factor
MQTVPTEFRNPVVALSGEIDMANAVGIAHSVKPLIEAGGPIVIDLSRVTFMDSTGVQALIAVADALGDRGCLILHGVNGPTRKVIEMTQLQAVRINIHVIDCSILAVAA